MKKAPSWLFDRILNTPLSCFQEFQNSQQTIHEAFRTCSCFFSEIFQGSKRLLFSWFLWTYRRFCLHWEVLQGHSFSRHLLKKLKHHKFLTVCVTFVNILICLFTFFWDCRNVLRQSAFWAFFQDTREARIMSLMPCSSINLNPCIYWIGNHFL